MQAKRTDSNRAFTVVEVLVVLVIVAILVALLWPAEHGPPPRTDADLDFTSWDRTTESRLEPPRDIVVANVNLAGQWWRCSRQSLGLIIESGRSGHWQVVFHSGSGCGFGPSVLLERTATYEAGAVVLDRPVQSLSGETFGRLYAVRIHGREYLIPSVRLDKLKEIMKGGTDKEQAEKLQREMLVRVEP
jgi:prepilin-type N-terminal cleavage/methylation domain-containing protein